LDCPESLNEEELRTTKAMYRQSFSGCFVQMTPSTLVFQLLVSKCKSQNVFPVSLKVIFTLISWPISVGWRPVTCNWTVQCRIISESLWKPSNWWMRLQICMAFNGVGEILWKQMFLTYYIVPS